MEGSGDKIVAEDASPPYDSSENCRISAAEAEALCKRRQIAGIEDAPDGSTPTIGLALSGGGIRSATFCLGLLRGLARNGVLKRFDYLSTVSGGGYIGAMFGRLIGRGDIHEAESILASSDTATLSWLRRYGRYLAPGGARDYGIGFATYLRAALAMHLEFAMAAMGIAALLILVHLMTLQYGVLDRETWGGWKSALLPLACLSWAALAPGLIAIYWMVPADCAPGRPARYRLAVLAVLFVLLAGAGAWWLRPSPLWPISLQSPWRLLASLALAGAALRGLGMVVRLLWLLLPGRDAQALTQAVLRWKLTVRLRRANAFAMWIAGFGLVDWLGWELYELMSESRSGLFGSLGIGGLLLLVVRTLNSKMSDLAKAGDGPKFNSLPMLINVIGFGVAIALLVGWTAVAQWAVFATGEQDYIPRLCWLMALVIGWFFATFWLRDSVNASSLHLMYCARLVRAYLGAANPARFVNPLAAKVAMDRGAMRMDVTELHPDDDIALANYDPPEKGGPIHLINVCLNQTRGTDTGLYNADRKGVPLVVSAYEVRAGCRAVPVPIAGLGTLGRWVAISGAVASPGAGAHTTPGWAALLFLAGVRVGYWLDVGKAHLRRQSASDRKPSTWLRRAFALTKFGRLHAEFTASFYGPFVRDWQLSDGGHFDNTGVHALLQRRVDCILLADCGADPHYTFTDLENLVRKARIDYGADIEFYSDEAAAALLSEHRGDRPPPDIGFLSLENMRDNTTMRGVLCARILYRAESTTGERAQGLLLVVKPNLHQGLDLDLQAYARRHQAFPQQSTGDQFFDEAQWESYRRLGEDFGAQLREDWLSRLPGWSSRIQPEADPAPVRAYQPPPAISPNTPVSQSPFWRIGAQSAAVGVLSVGALTALYSQVATEFRALQSAREKVRTELSVATRKMQSLYESSLKLQDVDLSEAQIDTIKVFREQLREVNHRSREALVARELDMMIRDDCDRLARSDAKLDVTPGQLAYCKVATVKPGRIMPPKSRYWTLAPPATADASPRLDWSKADASVARQLREAAAKAASSPGTPVPAATSVQATMSIDETAVASIRAEAVAKGLDTKGLWMIDGTGHIQPVVQIPMPTSVTAAVVATAKPLSASTEAIAKTPPVSAFVPLPQPDACPRSRPIELYVQVYDEQTRATMKRVAWAAIDKQVRMPGIENVVTTARARGVTVGDTYSAPTMRVHRMEQDKACAEAIAAWLLGQPALAVQDWTKIKVLPLPSGYTGRAGVVELWWPAAGH